MVYAVPQSVADGVIAAAKEGRAIQGAWRRGGGGGGLAAAKAVEWLHAIAEGLGLEIPEDGAPTDRTRRLTDAYQAGSAQ